jgi:threonine aldolase
MVNVDLADTSYDSYDLSQKLKDKNILVNGDKKVARARFVFHRDVDMKDTQIAIEAIKEILN